jgi:RNA polymerase sigma factor (sigma-70 family)
MESSVDYRGLAGRIRGGDRDAFDRLALAFWRPILGFFWRRIPTAEAEDLAQTVFVNVYRGLRRGAGERLDDREGWSRYLFGVARNALSDHYRRRAASRPEGRLEELFRDGDDRAERFAGDPGGAQAHDPLESEEVRAALEACIGELERTARSLVWLHFVEGRSKRELARALGRPESSVRSDMASWLSRLRRCLESKGVAP